MLRVLVVEDEWPARNYLVELLQQTGAAEVVAAVATLAEARQALAPQAGAVIIVFLDLDEVWACEAADRLTYVHSARGRHDLDLTLSAIATSFGRTLVRVHRNWLVNANRVLELERESGDMSLFVGTAAGAEQTGVRVPVAKERATEVREVLLASARGVRQT